MLAILIGLKLLGFCLICTAIVVAIIATADDGNKPAPDPSEREETPRDPLQKWCADCDWD